MKTNVFYGLVVLMLVIGINGCCKQFWPRKIVFTPELKIGIEENIKNRGIEKPVILVIGKSGKTFAMTTDGRASLPCTPPTTMNEKDEELQSAAIGMATTRQAGAVMGTPPPVCKSMENIQKIFPTETITILNVKRNPYCKAFRGPDGEYQEICVPPQ